MGSSPSTVHRLAGALRKSCPIYVDLRGALREKMSLQLRIRRSTGCVWMLGLRELVGAYCQTGLALWPYGSWTEASGPLRGWTPDGSAFVLSRGRMHQMRGCVFPGTQSHTQGHPSTCTFSNVRMIIDCLKAINLSSPASILHTLVVVEDSEFLLRVLDIRP